MFRIGVLGFGFVTAEFAAFGQQRHGVHQILQGHDADQTLVFDYGNDAGIAGGEFAEG